MTDTLDTNSTQTYDHTTRALYHVAGMDCEGCVKALTRSVQGFAPKARVVVQLQQGLVAVEGVTEQDFVSAVAQAGFQYGGLVKAA